MEETQAPQPEVEQASEKPKALKPQARKKLALMADQMRRHAKQAGLKAFMFYDAEEHGLYGVSGYYDAMTVNSIIAAIYDRHPNEFKSMVQMIAQLESGEKKKQESGLILPEGA